MKIPKSLKNICEEIQLWEIGRLSLWGTVLLKMNFFTDACWEFCQHINYTFIFVTLKTDDSSATIEFSLNSDASGCFFIL